MSGTLGVVIQKIKEGHFEKTWIKNIFTNNKTFTLFLINCCFKGFNNGLKFKKIVSSHKMAPRCSGHWGFMTPLVLGTQWSCNSLVSRTPGVKTPWYLGHWESQLQGISVTSKSWHPGVPDTRKLELPDVPDTGELQLPVSRTQGSHFSSVKPFSKLKAIDTDFKATTYQK